MNCDSHGRCLCGLKRLLAVAGQPGCKERITESQNQVASKILRGELQPRDSLSAFTNSTFKMCSEILDLWIEPLRAFINKSE